MKYLLLILSLAIASTSFMALSELRQIKPAKTKQRFVKKPPIRNLIETQEYVIAGDLVAKVASSLGYKFYLDNMEGAYSKTSIVSVPYFDGDASQQGGMSQIINGSYMSVGQCGLLSSSQSSVKCWNNFHLFQGKKLNPYWRIKNIEINNVNRWLKKPNINTNDPYTKIRVQKNVSQNRVVANLRSVTLVGPKNKKWKEAFVL